MPDISATIRSMLVADTNVSGVVSSRIHADVLPQRCVFPAIAYEIIDTTPNEHLSGIVDLSRARIQIDCYAKTRADANSLADKVRLAIEKKTAGTYSSQYIVEINLVSGEQFFVEQPKEGTDKRVFGTSQDFYVHYRTTTS